MELIQSALYTNFCGFRLCIYPKYFSSFRLEKFTRGIDQNVRRAQELTRRYNELMMKDIQENMNNLYDGPFNSGSMMGRTQGGGNIQQGMHIYINHR